MIGRLLDRILNYDQTACAGCQLPLTDENIQGEVGVGKMRSVKCRYCNTVTRFSDDVPLEATHPDGTHTIINEYEMELPS